MKLHKLLAASAMAAALSACAVGTVADAEKEIQRTRNDASDLRLTAAQPLPKAEVGPVRVHSGVWLGSKAKRRDNGDPLPRSLERDGVTLIHSEPLDLRGIAELISDEVGVTAYLDPDIFDEDSNRRQNQEEEGRGAASGEAMGIPPIDSFGTDDIFAGLGAISFDDPVISPNKMRVQHRGKLSDFLNRVGAKFDVGWAYEGGDIRFYKNLTRTFLVKALPSTSEMSMDINSDSSASGGTGSSSSSTQRSSVTATVNMWEEMQNGFSEIVGEGGRLNVSPSTGTVTISAPPTVMRRVDNFVRVQNERFSKQVAISVQVLNVRLSDADEYGLDFNSVLNSASGEHGLGLVSGGVDEALTSGLGINWTIFGGARGRHGADGLIRALSTRGDVSVVTSASATTLNNIPTPLQVGEMRDYVSEIEVDREEDAVTVDISTDRVTVGFNMQLLPRIVGDGRVLLQYNLSQSELAGAVDGFDIFEYEDQRIQLANINTRSFSQQVEIPNGSTLVLSGFEQSRSSVSKSGTGSPNNMLLGGEQNGSMEREVMVILLSPVILDAGQAIIEL